MSARPAVVPCVFYRDPIAAMKWLEQAFGFETTSLVLDKAGRVGHAEMEFHGSPVGVAGEWSGPQLGGAAMKSPASLSGAGTMFLRVAVESGLDALCDRARNAGGRITQEPEDQFYGARTFRVMDPEGHIWNFNQDTHVPTIQEMEAATGLSFHKTLSEAGHD